MNDPWSFGWTQLLTIIGMLITVGIAFGGYRTFNRWKREQLESRRIEIAFDALTLAYETKSIFGHVRSPIAQGFEWSDMPVRSGETEDKRQRRGTFYALSSE
jgi:hypothetical protein